MASFDTESAEGLENAAFDFIIVGGGTAGLVVASRLTEDPKISVVVLEAGTNRLGDPRITVPGLGMATYENPDFDWNFRSTPQVGTSIDVSIKGFAGANLKSRANLTVASY